MSKLFDPSSERSVTVALDHGLSLGAVDGFRDPEATLQRVLDGQPDGVLVGPHFARHHQEQLESSDVSVAITTDVITFSTRPGQEERQDVWTPAFDVGSFLDLDPAGVKMILCFGRDDRGMFCRNIEAVSKTAEALRGTGVPFIVEPVMWGDRIPDRTETDPDYIERAARMAWEYGADILKVPYTGSVESFESIAQNSPVPVLILGGPASGTTGAILRDVEESVAAGGQGLVIGRSIWKAEDPTAVIGAMNEIVHEGASVEDVW